MCLSVCVSLGVSVWVVFVCVVFVYMYVCVFVYTCAFACFLYVCYPVHVCIIIPPVNDKNPLYKPKVSTIPLCDTLVCGQVYGKHTIPSNSIK